MPAPGHHQAHVDDITLRTAGDTFENFDLNDPFDIGPLDGIGSQDWDLGLDLDGEKPSENDENENMSVDGSVGVGRDLPVVDESFDAQFMRNNGEMDIDVFSTHSKSREGSEHPFNPDMDIDIPEFELPIDFDGREKTPGQTRSSRACTQPVCESFIILITV